MTGGKRWDVVVLGVVAGSAVATTITTYWAVTFTPAAFGLDLAAYVAAADRLAITGTPYSPELRDGPIEHAASNIPIAYFYPPPLAQLFLIIRVVPLQILAVVWTIAQIAILGVVLLVIHHAYHDSPTRRSATLIMLATVAFYPAQVALLIGNVSGWIAIAVGLMLAGSPHVRTASAVAVGFLKAITGAFSLVALIDPRTRQMTIGIGLLILAISFAVSPDAWIDFVAVVPNLLSTPSATYEINLAPSRILADAGAGQLGGVVSIGLLGIFVILTTWNALRSRLLPAVASATGVYLCASSTSWHQYFIVLVPVAVAAWPNAGPMLRLVTATGWLIYGLFWFGWTTIEHRFVGLATWVTFLFLIGTTTDRTEDDDELVPAMATHPVDARSRS